MYFASRRAADQSPKYQSLPSMSLKGFSEREFGRGPYKVSHTLPIWGQNPLDWSGRAKARSGLRMMPTFPLPSLKFRTAGFPQYGFKASRSDRAFPFDALASDGLPLSFVLPASLVSSPFCAGGPCALEHLRSSGRCRSTPGALAPDRVVLSRSILTYGPIRPTRRHIPISPLSGLYEMPSLCTLRLGDLRVVPRFRCPSFLTCHPLRLRGDRKPVGPSHAIPT
jgi:hypothetical protein